MINVISEYTYDPVCQIVIEVDIEDNKFPELFSLAKEQMEKFADIAIRELPNYLPKHLIKKDIISEVIDTQEGCVCKIFLYIDKECT